MIGISLKEIVKNWFSSLPWPPIALMLLVLAILLTGGIFIAARGCSPAEDASYLETAKEQILKDVAAERKKDEEKLKALEADLYDLRVMVDSMDAEIQQGAEERKEIHDAIDNANSIDAIDRVLKHGVPSASGRRQ